MYFSVIIPVYNRPEELKDLLSSLVHQTYRNFEVIVVEDGSALSSEAVVESFKTDLRLTYIVQENTGQGFARNHAMKVANGDFYVIFDSDVILPSHYFEVLNQSIVARKLDAFGGPDAADSNFSVLQKAMNFAMTSFWTTGGIRGKLKNPASFQARGFNMGVSAKIYQELGGFADPNRGEDIEYSMRIKKAGFKLELVTEAFVYHKRKNTVLSFAKQSFSFGENRVNVSRFQPEAIKLVHCLPALFLLFIVSIPVVAVISPVAFQLQLALLGLWCIGLVLSSTVENRSIVVGLLSLVTALIQLCAYGAGLISEFAKKMALG